MKFFTWNTQGNFTAAAKADTLRTLFLSKGCSIGFIQEGGEADSVMNAIPTIPASVRAYAGEEVGAKNERCTCYVLVNNKEIKSGEKVELFNAIGGGVAGRKPAAIRLGNAIYVSWHSLSGKSNQDTSMLLDECIKKMDAGVTTIVIGGDFNAHAQDIRDMIKRKIRPRSSTSSIEWCVAKSEDGTPTHFSVERGDSELDYFVVFHRANANANANVNAKVDVHAAFESDHDPVIMDIPL
jgi:hypothetical protein